MKLQDTSVQLEYQLNNLTQRHYALCGIHSLDSPKCMELQGNNTYTPPEMTIHHIISILHSRRLLEVGGHTYLTT